MLRLLMQCLLLGFHEAQTSFGDAQAIFVDIMPRSETLNLDLYFQTL
jgi:hypothetical protein